MLDHNLWNQARGLIMVQAMKFITLIHMFDERDYPTLLETVGYIYCPATILFGPWISYTTYHSNRFCVLPTKKLWILRLTTCTLAALLNLIISNCVTQSLIGASFGRWVVANNIKLLHEKYVFHRWLNAYFKALSFRSNHYFVSYISEFSLVAAGYSDHLSRIEGKWGYNITNPWKIEFPISLKTVVIYWNVPMHRFLKERK